MIETRIVMVTSGALDPLHEGHVRYLRAAALMADRMAREANGLTDADRVSPWHAVTVHLLNSDAWLLRVKRRRPLLPQYARAEVVNELRGVDFLRVVGDVRDDVRDGLEAVMREHAPRPDMHHRFVFAKGGDRRVGEIPEAAWCRKHGWEVVDGVGGADKPNSSGVMAARLGLGVDDGGIGEEGIDVSDAYARVFLEETIRAGLPVILHARRRFRSGEMEYRFSEIVDNDGWHHVGRVRDLSRVRFAGDAADEAAIARAREFYAAVKRNNPTEERPS